VEKDHPPPGVRQPPASVAEGKEGTGNAARRDQHGDEQHPEQVVVAAAHRRESAACQR